jgi:hypothetical protein
MVDLRNIRHYLELDMDKYFKRYIEGPQDIAANPAPINVCYEYVSHTFLNGFINYVEILGAFAINRYREEKEFDEGISAFLSQSIHTNIRMVQDDVVILARAEGSSNIYCYFYYDMDCSDCEFGRFETNDSQSVVLERFESYIKGRVGHMAQEGGSGRFVSLPLNSFNGWIGW